MSGESIENARPFEIFKERESKCPFCKEPTFEYYTGGEAYRGPTREKRMCLGTTRWWWPFGCRLTEGHFHARCASCGARWIMLHAAASDSAAKSAPRGLRLVRGAKQ
jgi:hypothetical protein